MPRRLLPPLRDFLFIIVLAGALTTGSRMLNTDSDLGRHLTLGGYILSSGHIPTVDILSYTRAGAPRPPYEWLAQVAFSLANRLLALDGVVLLASLILAAVFTLVYVDSVQRSHTPVLALVLAAWAAVASSLHWLARPHLFSFLFFAVWLYGLERVRRGQPWPFWSFPALMLLWSNLHGGFIFGFIGLGAYLAGWAVAAILGHPNIRYGCKLLLIGVASAVASILTPDLWHNWDAVLSNSSGYILSRTVETMPLRITSPSAWPFIAMLVLAVVLLLLRRLRAPAEHLILLAGLAAIGVAIVRNIPFFAIAAAPIMSEWASEALTRIPIWRRAEDKFSEMDADLTGLLWPVLVVAMVIAVFAYKDRVMHEPIFYFRSSVFPVQAADWVQNHPQPGRMFNDFNWGGYLLYRLWPEQRVFIDSQSDFYGESLTRQAADIAAAAPGWQAALERYQIDWIFIPRQTGLAAAAGSSPGWRIVYQDGLAVIFVRK